MAWNGTRLQLRARVRRLPAGELIVRTTVFLVGALLIGTGLALSVLPGPFTLPPVLLGLLVWSLEFSFAERWLERVRVPALQAWEASKPRPVRSSLTLAASLALLIVGMLVAAELDLVGRVTGLVA